MTSPTYDPDAGLPLPEPTPVHELLESDAKYRALFENSESGLALHRIVLDDRGRPVDYVFLEVNPAFEGLTGLERTSILGRRITEVLPGIERDPADWIGIYGRVALGGGTVRFQQLSAPLGRWYDVTAYSPARGYFAVVFSDITEHKQREQALRDLAAERERALRALGEEAELRERFMAILSHDLRVPMGVVQASVELALRRTPPLEVRPVLERALRATRTMESLVNTLLDYSRLRSGQRIPTMIAHADLGAICRRVVDDFHAVLAAGRLRLHVEGDLTGRWDADRLVQVLGNLVGNALRHGDPQTPVLISARPDGDTVVLEVTNRGGPIPAERLPLLFEPFSTAEEGGSRRPGLGLGLYIVREIVASHGGRVEVRSTQEATTFTVRLPREPNEAPGTTPVR